MRLEVGLGMRLGAILVLRLNGCGALMRLSTTAGHSVDVCGFGVGRSMLEWRLGLGISSHRSDLILTALHLVSTLLLLLLLLNSMNTC